MSKIIAQTPSGFKTFIDSISVSSGIGDSSKIIQTDSTGKIDPSLLPSSSTVDQTLEKIFVAGEDIGIHRFVSYHTGKIWLVDPNANDFRSKPIGITITSGLTDENIRVVLKGIIEDNSLIFLTENEPVYCSETATLTSILPISGGMIDVGMGLGNGLVNIDIQPILWL